MKFESGNEYRFRPGTCPNPAGRQAGLPALRKQAVQAVMDVVNEIITDPANLQRWRNYVQEKWTEDPGAFIRNIVLPLSPRETLAMFRTTENGLATLTVSQLRVIASTLPQETPEDGQTGKDTGKVIDMETGQSDACFSVRSDTEQAGSVRDEPKTGFDPEAGF